MNDLLICCAEFFLSIRSIDADVKKGWINVKSKRQDIQEKKNIYRNWKFDFTGFWRRD